MNPEYWPFRPPSYSDLHGKKAIGWHASCTLERFHLPPKARLAELETLHVSSINCLVSTYLFLIIVGTHYTKLSTFYPAQTFLPKRRLVDLDDLSFARNRLALYFYHHQHRHQVHFLLKIQELL